MSHLRESILVPAILVASAALACESGDEDDTTAPALEGVRFADPQTLRLVFSESVVVGAADPAAFRLSLAAKDAGSTVYYGLDYVEIGYATYGPLSDSDPSAGSASASAGDTGDTGYDPTGYDPSADEGYDSGYDPSADGGYDSGGYAAPGPPDSLTRPIPALAIDDLGITAVRAVDGKPSEIDLVLAAAVTDTDACAVLAELAADGTKAGIFLHHRDSASSITDKAGNRLASVAAHWVDASAKSYVEVPGDFPNMSPYLPIPCP